MVNAEFKLSELFEKVNLKSIYPKKFKKERDVSTVQNAEFNLPLVNAKHGNNGIMYFGRDSDFEGVSMTLGVIGDGAVSTGDVNPHPQMTGVLYNAYLIKPKWSSVTSEHLYYTAAAVQKSIKLKFGYENKASWDKVKEEYTMLPSHYSNGEIAFDYMETYIKELEAERIKELESYLVATGLNDYILTDDEEKLINNFRNDNIIWGEFRIDELFKVQTSRKRFDANKVTIQKNGSPYVVRTSLNNGTRGLINEDQKYLNEANTISFGQDTATMFYQKKPYFTGDKIKVLIPKFKGFNEIIAQFLITSMTKSFSTFTWGSSSYNVKIINSQKIKVLTNSNGEPDYDKMILLIKSFEKLVIKGVVKWKDKQIEATRKVVSKNNVD